MSVTTRKNFKRIDMVINEERVEVNDQHGICEVAMKYFKNLFDAKEGDYDLILSLIQQNISNKDNRNLPAPITKLELYAALMQMHPDKSSGPDGFISTFFRTFGSYVGMMCLWLLIIGWNNNSSQPFLMILIYVIYRCVRNRII